MQNRLAAQAVRAGAFGGGREGVQQAELQDRILSQIGQAQQEGFGTALQAAQNQQRMLVLVQVNIIRCGSTTTTNGSTRHWSIISRLVDYKDS